MIQSDIAKNVADSLKVTLGAGEKARIDERRTDNVAAYVAYLKGRALLHDRSEKAFKGAKEQFEKAINEDPEYARAYAGLADISMLLGDYLFSPVPESLQEARYYIKKALDLDPDIAEARVSLAMSMMYEHKFLEAEREFRKAIALNPSYATAHHWYSNLLSDLGRRDEQYTQIILAEELDPLSSIICLSSLYVCLGLGKYDEAREKLERLARIDPISPLVDEGHMTYHFARKEWEETLKYLDKMMQPDPDDPYLRADLAYVYAVTGRKKEALEIAEKLKKEIPESTRGSLLAFVYAGLDDMDQVFHWLDFAIEQKEIFFGWFRHYPAFDNVRRDPRFNELLKNAGVL